MAENGVSIAGATGSTYTIASATVTEAGSYTMVATDSAGSAPSNVALLTIIVAPFNAVITITVE